MLTFAGGDWGLAVPFWRTAKRNPKNRVNPV
jgi:hypothetical protein